MKLTFFARELEPYFKDFYEWNANESKDTVGTETAKKLFNDATRDQLGVGEPEGVRIHLNDSDSFYAQLYKGETQSFLVDFTRTTEPAGIEYLDAILNAFKDSMLGRLYLVTNRKIYFPDKATADSYNTRNITLVERFSNFELIKDVVTLRR